MKPYRYKDQDGDWLVIGPRNHKPATALVKAVNGVEVTPADLPGIVAALYEACGLPSPVIAPRPGISIPADGGPLRCGDLSLRMYEEGIAMGLPGMVAASISPDELRRRAAFMVAYADAAEAEPDPAEVEELAALILSETSIIDTKPVARKILLAGYAKGPRDA